MTSTPAELLAARAKRVKDAYELRVPDLVPIAVNFGYMLARLGGITNQELERDTDKSQELLEKCALHFQPDVISGLGFLPQASIALGDRQTKWAGYGLDADGTFQFVEGEYMKAEEYDAFLDDPTDFTLRTFLPRAFSELEGLALLPRLPILLLGYSSLRGVRAFGAPSVVSAFSALTKASQEVEKLGAAAAKSKQRMEALGFPMSFGTSSLITAPFDFMSDTLRGMRGIMLDMFRCPDKLLAAMQKVIPLVVDFAVSAAQRTGLPYCSIPLHRGSDGFMSIKQFEKFYWPQLKELLLRLIEQDVTPTVFYEGVYDQRLNYLRELPKGKTIGRFDRSDLFKVKEVIGDTMCIQGGFPVSLLQAGTPEQIRELTKKMCEVVGKEGGFIMGPSTTISESDPELVKVWVDATREFGKYS
ncbi:MAG: hypothetical protein HZB51_13785 [Chloroflexi bacterium]|nr:hypothetical protein [Chloroflexota bacterium]